MDFFLRKMENRFKEWAAVHIGTSQARSVLVEAHQRAKSVKQQVDIVNRRWPNTVDRYDANKPVFLLSAGWRSGSTLLQRMLISSRDILIWGEPYGVTGVFQAMAKTLLMFEECRPLEEELWNNDLRIESLSERWIANLHPDVETLKRSLRNYFVSLFSEPARKMGVTRWGIKDVRLSAEQCHFIRWLFPDAKFIFLIRNPFDAYLSYRSYRRWFMSLPNEPIFTSFAFGKVWRRLTESFLMDKRELGAIIVRYEKISEKETIDKLQGYTSLFIKDDVLGQVIGSSKKRKAKSMNERLLLNYELMWLRIAVQPLAGEMGYRGPSY